MVFSFYRIWTKSLFFEMVKFVRYGWNASVVVVVVVVVAVVVVVVVVVVAVSVVFTLKPS